MNIRTSIFIIILFVSALPSRAQSKWSAGYRTGLELVNYQLNKEDFEQENYIWHNQLFLTKRMGDKFALEATLFHTRKNYFATYPSGLTEIDSVVNDVTQTKLGLSIAGKYYFLTKSKWSLYGQSGFTFTRSSDQYANAAYKQRVLQQEYKETKNSVTLFDRAFGGLGLDYSLGKRVYLNTCLNVCYKIDGITSPGNPSYSNWAANALIGAGFRI
jgi:outer membrane protein W